MSCIDREKNGISDTNAITECLQFFDPKEPFILTIDSINNTCSCKYYYADYVQAEGKDDYVKKFFLAEENCGDITLSGNLKLKGGASVDEEGTIATYHQLALYKEAKNKDSLLLENVTAKLEYKYTYL